MSLSDEEYDNENQGLFFGDEEDDSYNKDLEGEEDNLIVVADKEDESETSRMFKTLSSDDLEEEIRREVNDVMSVLELEYDVASILLRHFRWNKERLLEDYMDSPDKVLYESGGGRPSNNNFSSQSSVSEEPPTKKTRTVKASRSGPLTAIRSSLRLNAKTKKSKASIPQEIVGNTSPSTTTCEICCDTPSDPSSMMYHPRCGHTFCKSCWRDYTRGKVEDDRIINVACMQESCKTVLLENELKELLDENIFARYGQFIQDSYVLHDKSLKFCLYPACSHALRTKHQVNQTSILTVVPIATCTASTTPPSHTFCFNCETRGDHRPLICALATKWTNHVNEDAGSVSWIIANTKVCPKCQKPVEKNGGCRSDLEIKDASDKVSRSRADLEKWLFYYDRYMNHEKSIKLENQLVERIEEQITSLVNTSQMSWIEARFLQHAVDVLMKCRETLKVYVKKQHRLMLKDVGEGFKEGRWKFLVSVS
ncbi:hypothetical protein Clacol_006128 [Clathrus columnatus]|uniref:RBR-type E3 ubiquitin transferase n=1 Tax=Clathrus columnatus TaxID=1419009 RepID=A0AAV5AIW5_9AGAM|nr:hypothetical protein Clacol_006128 [Clathrus columnatus]